MGRARCNMHGMYMMDTCPTAPTLQVHSGPASMFTSDRCSAHPRDPICHGCHSEVRQQRVRLELLGRLCRRTWQGLLDLGAGSWGTVPWGGNGWLVGEFDGTSWQENYIVFLIFFISFENTSNLINTIVLVPSHLFSGRRWAYSLASFNPHVLQMFSPWLTLSYWWPWHTCNTAGMATRYSKITHQMTTGNHKIQIDAANIMITV